MEGGALDKACNELQALVSGLKPPKQLSKDVGESHTAHRLISCCQTSCCSILDLSVCTGHVSTALVQAFFELVHLYPVSSDHMHNTSTRFCCYGSTTSGYVCLECAMQARHLAAGVTHCICLSQHDSLVCCYGLRVKGFSHLGT